MKTIEQYEHLFATLRTDRGRAKYPAETLHRAPHKPLVLLSVLDLYAQGLIQDALVRFSPDLGELFSGYWYRVMPPYSRPNLALPCFHLKNDGGFWQLVATPGNERVLERTEAVHSMGRLQSLAIGARLSDDLALYLAHPVERETLRHVLLSTYFAPTAQARLLEQGTIHGEAFQYSHELLAKRQAAEAPAAELYLPAARSQGFRRAVVTAYDYRCATCGIRVTTADGHTAVEAAHIEPWGESHNDRPTNGLALCKLCHWCFDEGMLGIDGRRAITISPQLSMYRNVPAHLATLQQRPIIGPQDPIFAPDLHALLWHQEHIFQAH